MGRHDAAAFREQAGCWVRDGLRSVASVAHELGVPENILHGWLQTVEKQLGGTVCRFRAPARGRERRLRNLEEEHAILKIAMRLVASGRKSHGRSFTHTVPSYYNEVSGVSCVAERL
ncbi:MAG: hypothetical protein C7B45_09745 [Sulfobacillus acidophilus]|uniref:Transposase n=1 Tax=Sulfobacillus acidophilus TaxID=53633 RepID=A0A2T2WHF8_9FIRM|nr:MAG: hypothetical protein C7B45_09745 [Sulfobacillus acidophilus]